MFRLKKLHLLLILLLIFCLTLTLALINPQSAHAYNPNNLISDVEFRDWQALDADGIQSFLNTKGGTRLRTFSENGRTAAQIIATAAKANRINPVVILATIQKEESLVESNTNFDFRVNWAMGYGVCDSCDVNDPSLQRYRGFTTQINYGTWQLSYNYLVWAVNGSAWNVGRTMIIDGAAIHFDNRATSSLYRYTPHLNGNENFSRIYSNYRTYRPPATYAAHPLKQFPTQNFYLRPGQRQYAFVVYRNLGTATWYKTGAHPTYLGNSSPQDRSSAFTGGNVRWQLAQSVVRRNGVGTFTIWLTAPSQEGTYVEKFQPVMEGVTWFGQEATFVFHVSGSPASSKGSIKKGSLQNNSQTSQESYDASYVTQVAPTTLRTGQKQTIYAYFKNIGTSTWYQSGPYPTYLGNSSPQDRSSAFTGGNVRWQMLQSAVTPGRVGVFKIIITAPAPGNYVERFRPLIENKTWMGQEVTFNFSVR